jgi:uncharacterized membrane protein
LVRPLSLYADAMPINARFMHIVGSVLSLAGLLLLILVPKRETRLSQRKLLWVAAGLILIGQALQLWVEYA